MGSCHSHGGSDSAGIVSLAAAAAADHGAPANAAPASAAPACRYGKVWPCERVGAAGTTRQLRSPQYGLLLLPPYGALDALQRLRLFLLQGLRLLLFRQPCGCGV